MATYWYSTDGMDHKRLSDRHIQALDQAFNRQARVQIYDDEAFGPHVVAVANPHLGTMTAGDIHYGLYRNPSLWQESEASLDTFALFDNDDMIGDGSTTAVHANPSDLGPLSDASLQSSNHTVAQTEIPENSMNHYKHMRRRRAQREEEEYYCCVIS